MGRKAGRRIRLAEGIWQDRYGISAIVVVGTGRDERRFALGTELDEIKSWRDRRRVDLRDTVPVANRKGTLAADVERFLDLLPDSNRRDDFEQLLSHWQRSPLGARPRDLISRLEIKEQLGKWENDFVRRGRTTRGAAPNTLNHLLRALRTLYRELDGEEAISPAEKIKKRRRPKAEPRAIPVDLVQALLDNLPDRGQALRGKKRAKVSHTKIRLRVMAWSGLPQMQLERLRERDVDFVQQRIYVLPRRKGRGTKGVWLPLIPPAIDALKDYAAASLWEQSFSRSSMRITWQRSIQRTIEHAEEEARESGDVTELEVLRKSIPEGCRPYDLRHSFLTEAYRLTGDIRAVSELAQHAELETTKRYTEGAVTERAATAVAKMAERWQKEPLQLVSSR